jgi:hypothetical protein
LRQAIRSVLVVVVALVAAGCGGSRGATPPPGGHTYVLVPAARQTVLPTKDLYLTIVSSFAIPADVSRTSNARLVAEAKGRLDCSYTKPVEGLPGKASYLNGKTVTFKVNGSNPVTAALCSALKNERTLHPTIIGGK